MSLPQDPIDPTPQPSPDSAPPVPADVLAVPAGGLGERTEGRKRVVIIGGGLAGLVAGHELKKEGHSVVILEAQNRVGGRIYTLRNFAPGLYAEAGGMRIPRAHDLTLRYCELFDLPMRPFVMGNPKGLVHIGGGLAGLVAGLELKREGHEVVILEAQNRVGGRIYTLRGFAPGLYAEAGGMRIPRAHDLTLKYCELFNLPMRPFVMGNPQGLVYIGGERMTAAEANADPSRLPFDVADSERGRTADDLWESAIGELREMVERDGTRRGTTSCVSTTSTPCSSSCA